MGLEVDWRNLVDMFKDVQFLNATAEAADNGSQALTAYGDDVDKLLQSHDTGLDASISTKKMDGSLTSCVAHSYHEPYYTTTRIGGATPQHISIVEPAYIDIPQFCKNVRLTKEEIAARLKKCDNCTYACSDHCVRRFMKDVELSGHTSIGIDVCSRIEMLTAGECEKFKDKAVEELELTAEGL